MRVAILNAFDPETYKGGIESFILNLKDLFLQYNLAIDIHFMLPSPTLKISPFPIKFLYNKVPDFILDCFMFGRAFSKIEGNYDLVISNNFYSLGYFAPTVKGYNIYHSTHAAYADALRTILSQKDYRNLKYYYGYLGDRLSGRGKRKIAVSEIVNAELRKYYKCSNVKVVNHGIDTAFFKKMEDPALLRKKWGIPPDSFIGIFVGRWEIGKGIDILEETIRTHHDVLWILAIGDSECTVNGKNIRIIRNADKERIRELYSLSDFMLFPSYYEGFGLVIIEAMACELPVICTDVGVARDIVRSDSLKRLILSSLDKTEMLRGISERIAFLKKASIEKNKLTTIGRSIIERNYNLDHWKREISAALGLCFE